MYNNNKKERKNILLYLSGLFVTNIGNSASFIICGKYTYDYFGLASIFGALLIMESVQSVLFSGFAGYLTDYIGPKKISVLCDVLLFLIVLSGAILALGHLKNWSVILVYFVINLVKPFQNTANFSLARKIVENKEDLYRLNSKSGVFFQLGYLIGLGLTGIFIKEVSLSSIMLFDAFTFLLSGLLIFLIKIPRTVEKPEHIIFNNFFNLHNIKNEYLKIFKKNHRLFLLCLIVGFQINLIIAYNTNIFKYVAENLNNQASNLSLLEAAYTIICIATGWALSKKNFITIKSEILFFFLILQSLVFLILPKTGNIYLATLMAVLFGLVSSVIFPELFSNLYKCVESSDAGKLGGVKSMIQSLVAVPLLLFNSFLVDKFNLIHGYLFLSLASLLVSYFTYLVFNKKSKTTILTA